MYKRITFAELQKRPHPYIIDVREPEEFKLGHVPTAINIPVEDLLDNCEHYLTSNRKYYIYCETDLRSSRICEFLADLGYDVYLIEGGYKEWLAINIIN
ncbi:MAG: rhodanese-like domain-containing protein [Bacilli bacterium]|nr:rhodanese-like domain-containing protein [Bacilli bacterium]